MTTLDHRPVQRREPFESAPGTGRIVAVATLTAALIVGVAVGSKLVGSEDAAASDRKDEVASANEINRDVSITTGLFKVVDGGPDGRHGALPVTFTNVGAEALTFRTTVQATAPDGALLYTESVAVQDLAPGATTTQIAFAGVPQEKVDALKPARFTVTDIEGAVPFRR